MDGMLSQSEIDALLSQSTEVSASPWTANMPHMDADVKLYDFKRPEKFSREQLRSLERIHERFARLLSTTLSAYIRTNIIVKIESVTPLSYQDFVFSLPQQTFIQVIQLDPVPGQAALEINPTVVFPMYEQMMGGVLSGPAGTRPLTDVELVLLQRPMERVLQCLAETWQDFIQIKPQLLRAEQDPQFAQVAATNTPVIVVSLEVTIGEEFGMMSLCMPDVMCDELLHYLSKERIITDGSTAARDQELVSEAIREIGLPIIAELGKSELTVAQIRELKVGDTIKLDTEVGEDVTLYVGSQRLFAGRVGQLKRRLAVRLTKAHQNALREQLVAELGEPDPLAVEDDGAAG